VDITFVKGVAGFIAALVVFCGSIWFLMSLVLGPKLAYFITASVTLGFTLIMGAVWSFVQLGPVGQLPEWRPVAITEDDASSLSFGPASSYPDDPWRVPDENDENETTKAAELETDAADYLESALENDEITAFDGVSDATADKESVRLFDQDGTEYGAITFEAQAGEDGGPVIAVLEYDPGNPLGKARLITVGTLVLFLLHLFGLSRSERRTKEIMEASG
jgi:hypothetical protein